jgi:hypothetical protein
MRLGKSLIARRCNCGTLIISQNRLKRAVTLVVRPFFLPKEFAIFDRADQTSAIENRK